MRLMLPTEYDARKNFPLLTVLTAYFPDAIEALVELCKKGQVQHKIDGPEVAKTNPFYLPGDRVAWDRSKSTEELETLMRHLWDHTRAKRGDKNDMVDTDGVLHIVKVLWRAAAEAQKTIEAMRQAHIDSLSIAEIEAAMSKLGHIVQVDAHPVGALSSGCTGCGAPEGKPHNWPGCSGIGL
jgi:hypothetical protein